VTEAHNNNSIQFIIIFVPSQQLQGELQTQHSVDKYMGEETHHSEVNKQK
jgi:hypothetical protein